MSVLSSKRVILFVAATLLALPLFATNPSPRIGPRMAFDENAGVGILFGGRAHDDSATGLTHASSETWMFVRTQWVQLFPATEPPARSDHATVYDSKRGRIIMYGGRKEATVPRQRFGLYDDTWAWQNGDWHDLAPGTSPGVRYFPGLAYDRVRDKVILFGGFNYAADGKTLNALFDTWEYDGDNWTRVSSSGPEVQKPVLVYDIKADQTLMVGVDEEFNTLMYSWDAGASTWRVINPTTKPCANEAQLVYHAVDQRPLLTGGVCANTDFNQDTHEWDGQNWVSLTVSPATGEVADAAAIFDTTRDHVIVFGGFASFGNLASSVTRRLEHSPWIPTGRYEWHGTRTFDTPVARSMPVFRRDSQRNVTWMFGGLSEISFGGTIDYLGDLWEYRDGQWKFNTVSTGVPITCATPLGAMDTDRDVLTIICNGDTPYEWTGEEWKTFANLTTVPAERRFAGFVYDPNLKKFVLFGGYDSFGNYRQDTWTWNGTTWTEVKPNTKPPHRAQPVMWYDPLAKKTIMYSGAGRGSIEDRATRYSDMWSFDGSNWTRITENAAPGIRFAPQIAVDPSSGKLYMFGGLRATIDTEADNRVTQFYDDDMWVWDGSNNSWTELHPNRAPSPRQNGGFEFDETGKLTLLGGFAGNLYFSDRWVWDGQTWTPVQDAPFFRRRSTRG